MIRKLRREFVNLFSRFSKQEKNLKENILKLEQFKKTNLKTWQSLRLNYEITKKSMKDYLYVFKIGGYYFKATSTRSNQLLFDLNQ